MGRCRATRGGRDWRRRTGASPLLANVYLHYVLDVWFEQEVKPRLRGSAFLVRYADDFVPDSLGGNHDPDDYTRSARSFFKVPA
jgi:hypothetical protein